MSPAEKAERGRIFGKLCVLCQVFSSEREVTMRAYMDETRDLPPLVLSHAISRLVNRPPPPDAPRSGRHMPSIGEIKKEAAAFLRERHRLASGLDPTGGLPSGDLDEVLVQRWLARAHEPIPTAPTMLALAAGPGPGEEIATAEQRAKGAAMLAQLAAKMQAPREST